jgi:hypothetical protein
VYSSLYFMNICMHQFLGNFALKFGPSSNVVLDTPYLDEKIRLGVGARGILYMYIYMCKYIYVYIHIYV